MITAIDKNTALVLIDLQKGIAGGPTADPIKPVLEKASQLMDAFRKANLPIVIVNANPKAFTITRVEQSRPIPDELPAGFMDIVDEIKTQPYDIFITKRTWSAFYETGLHEQLQKRGVTNIVLGGVATSLGVEGTARAASELNYNISFAVDAMTDRVAEPQQHSLAHVFPMLGEQGSSADIIHQLNQRR